MKIAFFKYQGTGNDFILIDNRHQSIQLNRQQISHLCHRRFGIGADGLMLLELIEGYDFKMVYYNSDGRESSMCGNGGRCLAAFAGYLGLFREQAEFLAVDGPHAVKITGNLGHDTFVSLKMTDVSGIENHLGDLVLDTGSPHYIRFVKGLESLDVVSQGREVRNSGAFKKDGINVNFVEVGDGLLKVRTYERGVEDETYSCGTGVTAAALASVFSGKMADRGNIPVEVPGGRLNIRFVKKQDGSFKDIWLEGPATFVFKGEIEV